LFIILIAALVIFVLYLYFGQKRERTSGYTPYVEALSALLEDNEDIAIKKFKEAVSLDSGLIDAYIRLGDLYRKRGDVSRAVQIHQSLTVRPTLKKHEEKKVYYALVNDLLATTRYNKAVSFLKEILKIDKHDKHAQELILKIYEDTGNYGDCIALYEESGVKVKEDKRHAFYYASYANNKLKDLTEKNTDVEKDAVNLFKKALKILPNSLTALYYFGDYYEQRGNLKKAKECYHKLITKHPDRAFLIIDKFEKVYYELGLFDEIIPVYEKIFHANPKNFAVGLALAALYEKKNDLDAAQALYSKLSEKYPKSSLLRLRLLKSKVKDESLMDEITEIENEVGNKSFKCTNCGFDAEKFSFLCPKCHAIESFLLYL